MYSFIGIYILGINGIAFLAMYIDKKKAIKRRYRIPEKRLFLFAFLGGSIGTLLGMHLCRHKTKHKRFVIGIPLILGIQLALGIFIGSNV